MMLRIIIKKDIRLLLACLNANPSCYSHGLVDVFHETARYCSSWPLNRLYVM